MKKGFTLAEVLITLGIIGVIAVLTVPTVVQDYKNKLYVTQLKKVYIDVANAVENVMNDEHVDKFVETNAANKVKGPQYFLTNYIKHNKEHTCNYNNCQNFFSSTAYKYYNMEGEEIVTGLSGRHCVQTQYAAIICMSYNPNNQVATLNVDVNGTAEPNVTGRDAFVIDIEPSNNSLRDMYPNAGQCGNKFGDYTSVASYSGGCLQSIIENNWTMKY